MRTDDQLQRDVLLELLWEPGTDEDRIGVTVQDGIVQLTGTVPSWAQRCVAEEAAVRVIGVRGCRNELLVALPAADLRSDVELAAVARRALAWNVEVPSGAVTCDVTDGTITLRGMVERQFQRRAAELAVRDLTGVSRVVNAIVLHPVTTPTYGLPAHIRAALARHADLAPEAITVEAHDGRVRLGGSVRSFAERREAEALAWAAPGVTDVEDHIEVRA